MPFIVQREDDANLPVEKTYGEKTHDFIFNKLINFWTTLAISGLFVFWVKHSEAPIKLLGNKLPRDFHADVRNWFSGLGMFKNLPGGDEVARVTADALTINLPGLATILPSAWLGTKAKVPLVEALDKMHYGDDNDKDPRIVERHRVIETEAKPTFFGALLARLGGMTAGVFTGYLIGASQGRNMINRLGNSKTLLRILPSADILQEFKGIDHYASALGERIGGFVTRLLPGVSEQLDKRFRAIGISWEPGQPHKPEQLYNRSTRDWGKWTAADVMYTIVTSTTIGPFVALVGKLPFMSYKDVPLLGYHRQAKDHGNLEAATVAYAPKDDATQPNRPQTRLTHVAAAERINPQLQTQLNG